MDHDGFGPPPGRPGLGRPDWPGERGGFADGSGTVDITVTVTAPTTCDDSAQITLVENATFDIVHQGRDGSTDEIKGTAQTTSVRTVAKGPVSRSSTYDTTRTRKDAQGKVTASLHLKGNASDAFDPSKTPPTRTENGDFTYESTDSTGATSSGSVKITDVVRNPPDVCFWPVSGTIVRIAADGSTETLVFSSTCGSATLDGAPVDLTSLQPERGGFGHGERRHW
jgi:hypothetical protein